MCFLAGLDAAGLEDQPNRRQQRRHNHVAQDRPISTSGREKCQSKRLETDCSEAVRAMASPMRLAIDTMRMFLASRIMSVS